MSDELGPRLPRPGRSRWTSFIADPDERLPRTLREDGNPSHRARVEHNRDTILIHLSGGSCNICRDL